MRVLAAGMTRALAPALAALTILAAAQCPACAEAAAQKAFAPRDESPEDLPAGPGRDDTFFACTPCHGFSIVAQQGLTRAQWDESLTWMTVRHNMAEIAGSDRDAILDYLATHYAPKAAGPRGWKNPFAPQ